MHSHPRTDTQLPGQIAQTALALLEENHSRSSNSSSATVRLPRVWATGAMAVSVFGGALGGLLLLFRKSLAYYFFIMSLIGTIITMSHAMGVSGAGPRQIFEGLLMPVVMSIVFIWYSKMVTRKGWIS